VLASSRKARFGALLADYGRLTVVRQTPQQRTLSRAADALGSMERLAEALQVTQAVLADWVAGEAAVPTDAYLKALDIVARGRPRKS